MKIILFDADGVLTLPEKMFTQMYARSRGLDPEPFEQFFKDQWNELRIGKKDLKQSIAENPDLWQWDGTVDELVEYWCKTEDVRNEPLMSLISEMNEKGVACYLATDQEKYRGDYMKNVMFKGLFKDYFISSDLGYNKSQPEFFEAVIERLKNEHSDLVPSDVIFFDDSQHKVDSAIDCGIDGRLFTSNKDVETAFS